jgi:hypothetical protein
MAAERASDARHRADINLLNNGSLLRSGGKKPLEKQRSTLPPSFIPPDDNFQAGAGTVRRDWRIVVSCKSAESFSDEPAGRRGAYRAGLL